MAKEYIEREAVLKKAIEEKRFVFRMEDLLHEEVVFRTVYKDLAEFIKSIPAADVVEVRHGRWIHKNTCGPHTEKYHCSVCDEVPRSLCPENYCPNCGARMGDS